MGQACATCVYEAHACPRACLMGEAWDRGGSSAGGALYFQILQIQSLFFSCSRIFNRVNYTKSETVALGNFGSAR